MISFFTADFVVLDMKVDKNVPLILGRDFLATCKVLIDVGRCEMTISDNYIRFTYKIKSEMLKFKETKRAKMEQQCRAVMMTDLTKPHDPFEVEDPSASTIFIVNKVSSFPQRNKPNSSNPDLLKKEKNKRKKKKNPPKEDPEIYMVKTAKGR